MPESAKQRGSSAFLIAAVALPILVVGVFLVASAIPRWTVAPPAYDLLFRADGGYNPSGSRLTIVFKVRDGRLDADLQPTLPNTYPAQPSLFIFDHRTLGVTEVRLDLPVQLNDGETLRTVRVEPLANRRVLDGTNAPDGYAFDNRYQRGPGIVGEIFGMNRYGSRAAVAKGGRVVPIVIPDPTRYSIQPIGWLAAEGQ